jgi:hypothetical protein
MSTHVDKSQLKAIPTEYKGVTYRSKSEAMFAAWLEMYCEGMKNETVISQSIEYEPTWSAVGNYVFDFAVHTLISLPHTVIHKIDLIEFNPSWTTQSYRNEWASRCENLRKSRDLPCALFCKIHEGNFWNGESNSWIEFGKDIFGQFLVEPTGPWIDSATAERIKRIRFDLKGGA